jgi:hypothetical protein
LNVNLQVVNTSPGAIVVSKDPLLEEDVAVCWLTEKEFPEWDRFVTAHPHGTAYQLSGWNRFLAQMFPHIRGRILALRNPRTRQIAAGIPLYVAKSYLLGRRLVSIPFATLCDPLVNSAAQFEWLLPHILDYYRNSGCARLEIKTFRSTNLLGEAGFSKAAEFYHHFVDLPADEGALKQNFSRNVRRWIAKAEKAGVEVKEDSSPEALVIFGSMHEDARRRLRLPPFPKGFFESMCQQLPPGVASVLVARRGGRVLTSLLSLNLGSWVIFEYLADSIEARNFTANHLLYWTAMQRGILEGRRFASFGRTSSDDSGLLKFKRSWGVTEEKLLSLVYPQTSARPGRRWISSFGRKCARFAFGIMPRPLARLVGNFCYRHWA